MNARKRTILNAIERGPQTAAELVTLTGAPRASVRRLVQSLRDEGYGISFAWPEEGGTYRFHGIGAVMGTDNFGNSLDGN
jgi:DNA-binding IclR family transcriptional regulator